MFFQWLPQLLINGDSNTHVTKTRSREEAAMWSQTPQRGSEENRDRQKVPKRTNGAYSVVISPTSESTDMGAGGVWQDAPVSSMSSAALDTLPSMGTPAFSTPELWRQTLSPSKVMLQGSGC
ncbi:hypothetical protein CCHR01_18376 [Colletotrichum chrysophilum]|uniref:Uncharacterized protein n=1 Tax=Colletotrichum chrysophilum TaxID=1836956 RepID=A0AAD9E8Z5_9PEZI|nr:hypothetical protein CCHR01_18376 [Colletotrichum chrysophilum]